MTRRPGLPRDASAVNLGFVGKTGGRTAPFRTRDPGSSRSSPPSSPGDILGGGFASQAIRGPPREWTIRERSGDAEHQQ